MSCDVFLYVQHLLGIGHLRRASVLARSFHQAGLEVTFVSGGRPVPHLNVTGARFIQLPSLHAADNSFKILEDESGQIVDEKWKSARSEILLRAFREAKPKVLLLEMFPFGRRQMRFELDPLIALAKEMSVPVLTSVRDILTTHKTPGKSEWIIKRVKTDIDHVLVHGDPRFIPLEDSFPLANQITDKIIYTGYVLDSLSVSTPKSKRNSDNSSHRKGVLVSAGGGAVALPLAETVLAAKALCSLNNVPWLLLLGDNLPESDFHDLVSRAPKGLIIERNRPDFPTLLTQAQLSISQAGYNTILETLAAETPAIVVPFAAEGQSEQTTRAELLAARGVLQILMERDLTPSALATAIDQCLAGIRGDIALDMKGAEKSTSFIKELIQKQG
ncbi:glycosyltransferase [Kiloniella laminariae]|uniref:Glycosyltransferase n=1 Tax=Kiloniella laminariae TaxID=454162 RepID=A0ABT4LJ68_9PROT|nr:glycosyltransferase [Kiloniella laminariae]MCZ4281150.1 glycosyltransferase [Kiloniella laminariae]